MSKAKTQRITKMAKGEAEQVRHRRDLGHDFALRTDEFGRSRLVAGTAEATRVYEVSNDGHISTGGIARVRRVDPLKGISSLTENQRLAGAKYREVFEYCQGEGASAIPLQIRVDGGKGNSGVPEALSIAHEVLSKSKEAMGHWEIVRVVTDICVAGLTASDIAAKTGDQRQAISKLLNIGLDNLAVHYRIVPQPK